MKGLQFVVQKITESTQQNAVEATQGLCASLPKSDEVGSDYVINYHVYILTKWVWTVHRFLNDFTVVQLS